MNYRAIFLDIDGTILKPDHTYTESTKDAILQLKEQDIEVFLATGRPLHEVKDLAAELQIESFIGYNGAYAVYQNETIVDEPMDTSVMEEFLNIAEEKGHELVCYTSGKNYFTSLSNPDVKKFIQAFNLVKNDKLTNDVIDSILGATVMNLQKSEETLYEFRSDVHLSPVNVYGMDNNFDIIRKNVNKGIAVENILKQMGIEKGQAIAFGDGMNDKEMLGAVGESFAMENAHPSLFRYAKHKTTSVDESGIYNGLQQLGLVK
ncbi:HAD family hydrolase [Virgibacillus kimchii]